MQVLEHPQILSRKSNNSGIDQLIMTNKNSQKSMVHRSQAINSNIKSPQQSAKIKISRMSQPQSSYCTKHNQCQSNYHPNNDDSQFSIDSQYLRLETPLSLQIQPEIQIQVKPNIDILISTNLRVNKYKQTYQRIQKQQQLQNKNQQLKKLQQSAKQALLKTKTQKQPPQNKWGHSIYQNYFKKTPQSQQKSQTNHKPVLHSPKQKKQNLQNATQKAKQRIIEFKQKQLEKQKQQQKQQLLEKQKKLDEKKLSEVNNKIVQNAAQILKQKQAQIQEAKKKKQEIKRKIQQLQKQSLNNCKKSRQNPLKIEEGKQQQFNLESSQYSTFQARKQGRKMVKKQKKKKNIQQKQANQQSKIVSKTNSRRFLKEKMTKTAPNFNKTKKSQNQKQKIDNQQQNQNDSQQQKSKEFKKFYVWNVPIKQQDYSLIALSKKLQEQKALQNQRKKQSQKSFKDEAAQYLRQKQLMRIQAMREKSRKQLLQQRIAEKKQEFIRQYQEMYQHNKVAA